MKIIIVIALMAMFGATMLCGSVMAGQQEGPAPNSGDGIPDGSGMDSQFQNGKTDGESPGPAPNSADGIPDGPGW